MNAETINRLKILDQAISRLEEAHVQLPFTLKETGTIGAPVGGYRVYQDKKNRNVLLFAFSTELFNDANWPDSRHEVANQLYVVDARHENDGLNWVENSVQKHQRLLEEKMFQDLNLYDLGNDIYANKKVSYKLSQDKEDPNKWRVRFRPFGLTSTEDEQDLNPQNLFDKMTSQSLNVGEEFDSREAAYERMRTHFSRKVDNIWRTGGPIRMSDRMQHPNLLVKEFGGKSRNYFSKTPFKVLALDLGIVSSIAMGHVFGGIGHLMGEVAEVLHNYRSFHHQGQGKSIANNFVSKQHRRKVWARLARAMVPYHYDAAHDTIALGRCVDAKILPNLTVLEGEQIPFKSARSLGIQNTHKSWPIKWMMRAFQLKFSSIVAPDHNGLVTIDTRTGLTLHHIVGENRAFAQLQSKRSVDSLTELPPEVRNMLKDGHVTEIKYDPIYGFCAENITQTEFHNRALDVTNNQLWHMPSGKRPNLTDASTQRMRLIKRMTVYANTVQNASVDMHDIEVAQLLDIQEKLTKALHQRNAVKVGPPLPKGFKRVPQQRQKNNFGL